MAANFPNRASLGPTGSKAEFQGLGLACYFSKLVLLANVVGWAVELGGRVWGQHGTE